LRLHYRLSLLSQFSIGYHLSARSRTHIEPQSHAIPPGLSDLTVDGLQHNSKSARILLGDLAAPDARTITRLIVTVSVDYDGTGTEFKDDPSALPAWTLWTRDELPELPNVHSLTLHGPVLCCPHEPYGFLLPLLTRLPNLHTLRLLTHASSDQVPAGIDLHTMLPDLTQLECLVLGDVPLVLVHALLRKTGPRLHLLIVRGKPIHPRSAQLQISDTDTQSSTRPESYASSISSSHSTDTDRIAHRVDLATVLLDLQLRPSPNRTRIRNLWVVTYLEPWSAAHVSRIGRVARFLPSFDLLERISHLTVDRWVFCAMMSQDVAPPTYLRSLIVMLNRWIVNDSSSAETFGSCCTSVDGAFGVLGGQIEKGVVRYLREVGVGLARFDLAREVIEERVMRGRWMEFREVCARRRLAVWFRQRTSRGFET